MRSLILGTMTAAVFALGASTAVFAAPAFAPHEQGRPNTNVVNVRRTDYYWNHHHFQHRDWDRHHHRWHSTDAGRRLHSRRNYLAPSPALGPA
jgi:hypothetical protein